jgi:hypothetical protein
MREGGSLFVLDASIHFSKLVKVFVQSEKAKDSRGIQPGRVMQ